MANEIQIFNNEEFGSVRTIEVNGEPYFVGKDVAEILGYSDLSHAILDHVDAEDRFNSKTQGQNTPEFGQRGTWLINESGLYSLILSSKMPNAKKFKRWVTSEVLPAIRKTGNYSITDKPDSYIISDPIERAKRWIEEYEERKALEVKNAQLEEKTQIQEQQILEYEPKVTYYDIVLNCQDAQPITVIAKDYGKSPQWLNSFLKEQGVQYKCKETWVLKQKYASCGYTKTKTYYDNYGDKPKGHIRTLWTQKGRLFIYDFLKSFDILPIVEREYKGERDRIITERMDGENN